MRAAWTESHTQLFIVCLIALHYEARSGNGVTGEEATSGATPRCISRLTTAHEMREDEQLFSTNGTFRVLFACAAQMEILNKAGARVWTSVIDLQQRYTNGDCMLRLTSSGNLELVNVFGYVDWQTFSRARDNCSESNRPATDRIFAFVSDAGELTVIACGETVWSTSSRPSEPQTRLHTPFLAAGFPIYPGSFLASPSDNLRLLFDRDGSLTIRATVLNTILWDADETSPSNFLQAGVSYIFMKEILIAVCTLGQQHSRERPLRGKRAAVAQLQYWDANFAVQNKNGEELWAASASAFDLRYRLPDCEFENIRLNLDDDGNLNVHVCDDRPSWRIARARNLNEIRWCTGNATTSALFPNRLLKPSGCLSSPSGQYRFEVSAFGDATLRNLSRTPSSGDDIVWSSRAKDSLEVRGLLLEKSGGLLIIDLDDQITWSLIDSSAEAFACNASNPNLALDDSGMLAFRICGRVVWFASARSGCKTQMAAKGGSLPRGFLLFPGSYLSSPSDSFRLQLTCSGKLELRRQSLQPGSNATVMWTPPSSLVSTQLDIGWLEYSYENGVALRDSSQVLWRPMHPFHVPQRSWTNRKLGSNALRLSDSGTLSVQSVGATVWRQDCDSENSTELLQYPVWETLSVGTFLVSPNRSSRIGRRCSGEMVWQRNIFGCQSSAFPSRITANDSLEELGYPFDWILFDGRCGNASQRAQLRLSDNGDAFAGTCKLELAIRDIASEDTPLWWHIIIWNWNYASICYQIISEARHGQQSLTAQDCLQMLARCRMQECFDAASNKNGSFAYRLCSASLCEFLQNQLRLVNEYRSQRLDRLASTGTGTFPPKRVLQDLADFDRMWHLHLIGAACSDSPAPNKTGLARTYCSLIPQAFASIFVITYWGQNFGIVSSHTSFIQLRFYKETLVSRTHPGAHAGQTNLLYWAPFFCVGVAASMATIKRMLSEDYSLAMTLHFAIFIVYAFIFFATVCTWCLPMFLLLLAPFCEFISPEKLPRLVYDVPYRLCETLLSLSNFLQAALCAERFIALYFPMYFGRHNTQRNGRRAVLLALAYGVLNGFFQFYSALYYGWFIDFKSNSLRDTIVAGITVALQSVIALSVELVLGFLIAAKLVRRYWRHKKDHVSNNAASSTVSACILVLGSTVLTICLEIPHMVMRGLGVINDANMDNLMDILDPKGEGLYRSFMMYYRDTSYLVTPNMASLVFLVHLMFGRRYRVKAAEALRLDRVAKQLNKLKCLRAGVAKNAVAPMNAVGRNVAVQADAKPSHQPRATDK